VLAIETGLEIDPLFLSRTCDSLSTLASILVADKADKRVATGIKKFRFFMNSYYTLIK
jgi:hypothetical protein